MPGTTTKRKLVAFFVDDWGSIRMSSLKAFSSLVDAGINISNCRYNRYETIESNSDLENLFDVLASHRDKWGNSAVFTALSCVANPAFDRIRDEGFKKYYYEPFTETLKRYPEHDRVFDLWKEGIRHKVFIPQFHGREHLNVIRWMHDLRKNVTSTHLAFNQSVTGINRKQASDILKDYQAAFDVDHVSDLLHQETVLRDGLMLFEKLLGYKANFFTPTNALFNHSLDGVLFEQGVEMINVAKIDREPVGSGAYKRKFHFFGQKNKLGQRYIVRNALFEPGQNTNYDWVDKCLSDIDIAFRWKKPALISSHRVNFSGFLHPKNRDYGLNQLDLLLGRIRKKWPDVEFGSTSQLLSVFKKAE